MSLFLTALCLCLGLALGAPRLDPDLDGHWQLWKSWHNKDYHEREESWRRVVWEKNLKMIELHNLDHTLGKHSYKLGMNQFGDMTTDEFRQLMNGYVHKKSERKYRGSQFLEPNFLEVPRSVDWREKGYVTPVKDQDDEDCRYKAEYNAANDTGFVDIPEGHERALMKAVAAVGPVSVAIDAGHTSFQFYQSGIYYEPDCSSEDLDHGVLVVGYGFEGEDVDGKKYWIVKNSWGEKWGDKGYIYMAKDRKNHCGIATAASYPLV
ncbi:cathepsin L1-like isoform X3 [Willisornis vidua]|uniref:Cathepsin L1-like isoform X3 n=1 Tax=Willisornis vidua TaxID=1566151 RepID=A0ABQ9CQK2_9PASS|nr:cathepsin L1-like isoform X3 [Willisornis vidua]